MNHLRDYDRAQYYKKIIANCIFNNYKEINNKFEQEYFKKTNDYMLHKKKALLFFILINIRKKIIQIRTK